MIRSAAGKIMWVARAPVFLVGLAVLLALVFTRDAAEAFRKLLTRQLEEIDGLGDYYQPGGLVFATTKGTLLNPTNLRKRSFAPLHVRAGLPH